MTKLFSLTVAAAWDETTTLRGLRLIGPPELQRRYQSAGQYLEVSHPTAGRGYFALASAPDRPDAPAAGLELLLRRGGGLSDTLVALPPGAAIEARDVLGAGFPLSAQRGRDLVLAAAGSGIAPLRALLHEILRQRSDFGQVSLYYGQRDQSDLAYQREFSAWRAADIAVVPVLSQPSPGWSGARGYVQQHLRGPLLPGTSAFLCGMTPMIEGVTAALLALGVPRERVFLNY